MVDFTRFKEQNGVGFAGVDVQSAGLSRLVQHLYDARQIQMLEASAERCVGPRKHFRGLETMTGAAQKGANMTGDVGAIPSPVDVIVAARAIGFQRAFL